MDYRRTYQLLIDKRRNNPLPDGEYGEVHHIVPRSEGGSDEPDNLVKLTAREHYVAHLLLARIYNDASMWAALMMMSSCKGNKRQYRVSSRLYQHARSSFAEHHSKVMKQIANTPWFRSIMSKAHKGKPPHNKGKPCSEEQKEKLRQANLGKKQPKETIQKRVQKLIGQKRSEEARRKMSERQKGKVVSEIARKNMSKSHIGHSPSNKGVPCSEEQKLKLRNAILGRRWFNNGIVQKQLRECPEGWFEGRLRK